MADVWKKSKLSESAFASLVDDGLLRSQAIVQWHSTMGNDWPYEGTNEIVLFRPFVEQGLAIPTSDFLRGILIIGEYNCIIWPQYYLAYLHFHSPLRGLLGHEAPLRSFPPSFPCLSQPSQNDIAEVGGAEVQLCQGMEKKYISYKLSTKVVDWKSNWFYVGNHEPSLPDRMLGPSQSLWWMVKHCSRWRSSYRVARWHCKLGLGVCQR